MPVTKVTDFTIATIKVSVRIEKTVTNTGDHQIPSIFYLFFSCLMGCSAMKNSVNQIFKMGFFFKFFSCLLDPSASEKVL